MPNDIIIANLIPLRGKNQYGFTLQFDGNTVMGMRIYAGAVQPPQRKHGSNWYPCFYASPELTQRIWEAAKAACPDLIGPLESTRRFLEMDDFTKTHINLVAVNYLEAKQS